MDLLSTALTLMLIMDPLGNIPMFMAALKKVPEERRRRVIFRECLFALAILMAVWAGGRGFMGVFGLSAEALRISGGIVLFLIALRMIFPPEQGSGHATADRGDGSAGHGPEPSAGLPFREEDEPFVVPLATPLIAGPSVIAALMILTGSPEANRAALLSATLIAWGVTTLILLIAPFLARVLRRRGLIAVERLMGMLLIVVAVQMFLDGLHLPSRVP